VIHADSIDADRTAGAPRPGTPHSLPRQVNVYGQRTRDFQDLTSMNLIEVQRLVF